MVSVLVDFDTALARSGDSNDGLLMKYKFIL
jgi:hypothetical protein